MNKNIISRDKSASFFLRLSILIISFVISIICFSISHTGFSYAEEGNGAPNGISKALIDEIKDIHFTDQVLLDSLDIKVGSDYVIKAINLAKEDGKLWKDLTNDEKEAYYQKAKEIVLKDKIKNFVYYERFNEIKDDISPSIEKLGLTNAQEDLIKNNKHHFVMGLTYLDKLYDIPIDNSGATLIDKLFGGLTETQKVQGIINIGKQSSTSLSYNQISNLYANVLVPNFSKDKDFKSFLLSSIGKENRDKWFKDNLKALNYVDEDMNKSLFDRFADYDRTLNHILPLLNLKKESIYLIINDASITYGLYDTYVTDKNPADEELLAKKIKEIGEAQKYHIKIWEQLSNNLIPNRNTVVKDALRIKQKGENAYEFDGKYTSKNTWAGKYDTYGLREFFTPLNMYSDYVNAGAVAESPSDIRMFINRALDYRGLSAYSHELVHLYNEEYLQGNDTRLDIQPELYPRGLLESFENDAPIFGLNLIYENREWMNSSYKQFMEGGNAEKNIRDYMNKQLDLIYSLEIIEANELIKRGDKADFLKKLSQEKGNKTQAIDTFSNVNNDINLKSVSDFVDNDLVVKRYDYSKRTADQNFAMNNDYHTIPLFSSFYAGSENPDGSTGDVSLRRLSFELLGEFGYTDGVVPYLSNKHIHDGKLTDKDILPKIFDGKYKSMKDFKKAMYDRRIKKLDEIKDVKFEYRGKEYGRDDIEDLMKKAIEEDKKLTSETITNYAFKSSVEELKKSIYKAYKKETKDFRDSIYKDEPVPETYKVTHEFKVAKDSSIKEFPEAVKAEVEKQLPDTRAGKKNGAVVEPGALKNPAEVEDKANDGKWKFKKFIDQDPATEKVDAKVDSADVNFVGEWTFVPNKHKVTYEYKSGTAGMELPDALKKKAPSEVPDKVKGDTVKSPVPTGADATYRDEANKGTWKFKSYDKKEVTIVDKNEHVVGTWVFEKDPAPKTYKVTHKFESEDPTIELPEAVKKLVPSDQSGKKDGSKVNPTEPKTKKVETNDGTWTFTSYDKVEKTVEGKDVEFVGTWKFTQKIYYVKNGDADSKKGKGTIDSPFESLIYALEKAKDGDEIIIIEDVTLDENHLLIINKKVKITLKGNAHLKVNSIVNNEGTIYTEAKENAITVENKDEQAMLKIGNLVISSDKGKIASSVLNKNLIKVRKLGDNMISYKFEPEASDYKLAFVKDGYQILKKKFDKDKDDARQNEKLRPSTGDDTDITIGLLLILLSIPFISKLKRKER